MDIAELKRTRGRLFGFIMGLIASMFGALFALIIGTSLIFGNQILFNSVYNNGVAVVVALLLFVTVAISIVGASLIRSKRIVGGLIIIGTNIPLFAISVIDPAAFSTLSVTSLVCIASGIIALIPLPSAYFEKLAARQHSSSQIEPYSSHHLQQENDAVSVSPIGRAADVHPPSSPSAIESQDDDTQW